MGWMQAIILIYHYTHGSQFIWVYKTIRVLVSSYMFMTGFKHTMYFLRQDDFTLKRVVKILVPLNLLGCVLPWAMDTNYDFYYFVPLSSFWFVVIYLTMNIRIGTRTNSDIGFLLCKLLVSAVFSIGFIRIPGIAELVAYTLRYLFTWKVQEWRFRTFLDSYIVYIGMLFAIVYHRRQHKLELPVGDKKAAAVPKTISKNKAILLVAFASILFCIYWRLAHGYSNKNEYNKLHPYISWIPIFAFIILRNSHSVLREHYSGAFAWLGRCSLETFVLQYHIWLAGDSNGLLRIGLWSRYIESPLLSVVFLYVSWRVADATQKLTKFVIGRSCNLEMRK